MYPESQHLNYEDLWYDLYMHLRGRYKDVTKLMEEMDPSLQEVREGFEEKTN